MRVTRSIAGRAAVLSVSGLLLATLTTVTLPGGPTSAAPDHAGAGQPPVPSLTWTDCGDGYECATAEVPLDYAHPRGEAIDLALTRLPATDPEHRIGSLFVNPGGPGGSGTEIVRQLGDFYPAEVLARFDLVGFDPRFVGESQPVRCFATDEEYLAFASQTTQIPFGKAAVATVAATNRDFAAQCGEAGGAFLEHMSTVNVARDLDLLRAAVGDNGLNLAGYSYGTYLAQVYANLFPDRVRALVLDGVIDPREWSGRLPEARRVPVLLRGENHISTGKALGRFFDECAAAAESCTFSEGGDLRARYDAVLAALRSEPVVLGPDPDSPRITYSDVVLTTLRAMYSPFAWPQLSDYLSQVEALVQERSAGGSDRPVGARLRESLRTVAATYPNRLEGFLGVICTDALNPTTAPDWARAGRRADAEAPYFGRAWAWASHLEACASWPATDPHRYDGPWKVTTPNPVLLLSGRYDPATPHDGAKAVLKLLPKSRLVTLGTYGHTSLNAPNTCALEATAEYLVSLTVPPAGTTCPADFGPFDAPGADRAAGRRFDTLRELNRLSPFEVSARQLSRR